jgi:chemotaxis signal transduction protein
VTESTVPRPREAGADTVEERVRRLRTEFDQAFTRPVLLEKPDLVDVLTFRIDQEVCAIRVSEIAEVTVRPALTRAPARTSALLGLAATRGRVVAAFDLCSLLGGTPVEPRWLLVPAAEPTIGLTFAHFEGHRQVHPDDVPTARMISAGVLIDAVRALSGQNDQPGPSGPAGQNRHQDQQHRSGDRS